MAGRRKMIFTNKFNLNLNIEDKTKLDFLLDKGFNMSHEFRVFLRNMYYEQLSQSK